MQFDRERVSWKGNEAVLDDFAGLDWPNADCTGDDEPHDAALAASLAATNPGRTLSASTILRRRLGDSDTDLGSPLRSSGSWGAGTDGSWGDSCPTAWGGEVHTPRNVLTADSAFVMEEEAVAALCASQDQVSASYCRGGEGR
jgi:hypothetical protein